ncbi:hypothetical protein Q5P01_009956 [Channa striata]|uniref:Ig-like domain-containing protein n=1 Tax=Channa striata TaxID=64152 RepID=A0AA88SXY5_CHASR|nr:hypothetical protein Q5P01_009956 [Channa striata]
MLLTVISCLCIVPAVLSSDECSPGVMARREKVVVPQGSSLTLSCVVKHCGKNWTGNWMLENSHHEKLIESSDRYYLTNETLSANETKLFLNFRRVNQSDEGSYGCKIIWGTGHISQGHLTLVNITAAVPAGRNLLHRFLICGGVFLCLTVVLGLACCQCSRIKHQHLPGTKSTLTHKPREQPRLAPTPLPRRPIPKKRSTSPCKAPAQSERRAEVVYADISQGSLKQLGATREPAQSTVYSSVRFS